ncbi:MAG TPA: C-type lectin domain-containing protein [Gemmatales bacterium]|nr:C-type lectin domain-containing protein [Gemmatales bacterium]
MYRFLHTILLTLLATTATLAQVSILGSATNPDNGHLYHILTISTWTDAEAFAVSLGGHLVTINTVAENTWVTTNFSQFGGINRPIWLGLNDAAVEGSFVWTSGEAVTYTNWAPGEPNNSAGIENYAYINPPGNPPPNAWPTWNDFADFGQCNGVVELASVPEPSSLALGGLISIGCAATCWYRTRTKNRCKKQ